MIKDTAAQENHKCVLNTSRKRAVNAMIYSQNVGVLPSVHSNECTIQFCFDHEPIRHSDAKIKPRAYVHDNVMASRPSGHAVHAIFSADLRKNPNATGGDGFGVPMTPHQALKNTVA